MNFIARLVYRSSDATNKVFVLLRVLSLKLGFQSQTKVSHG